MNRNYKIGDWVKVSVKYTGDEVRGKIIDYDRSIRKYCVDVTIGYNLWTEMWFAAKEMTKLEFVSYSKAKKHFRYEVKTEEDKPDWGFKKPIDPSYDLNLADMAALVYNLGHESDNSKVIKWLTDTYLFVHQGNNFRFWEGSLGMYDINTEDEVLGTGVPSTEYEMAQLILFTLLQEGRNLFDSNYEEGTRFGVYFARIYNDIINFMRNKPVKPHFWSVTREMDVCYYLYEKKLYNLTEEEKNDAEKIFKELLADENSFAIEIYAELCLRKDDIFDQNYKEALDMYKKLYEAKPESRYYCTKIIAAIYNSGKHNNGNPEYDKAEEYLAITER